jgi:eukaryotic-like serine/threonine-protein kinase
MPVSKQFGRYRIVKHLATGGMAKVLLATATGIEGFARHVVIKQIDPQYSQTPTFVQMFLDEARLAASLHHHNIIQVHDIGKEGSTYFFAMEYVHGEDLRNLLIANKTRKEQTPLEHAIAIITAAASALHYAHDHCGPDRKPLNLVHRDVSPSNILIGFDGNVKVVDFGIAKTALASTETRAGDIKGKLTHMSPEQCLGKAIDRRSDVFALGIVLHELITVRRLFRGESDYERMKGVIEDTIPPPSKYRPDLPAELDWIILKALERDPAHRYQTADELRVALERFAINHNLRCSTSALADYMKQLFGERPEPWLVDDNPPEVAADPITMSVPASMQPITQGFPVIEMVPAAPAERPAVDDEPVSKTPMAWAAVLPPPVARNWRQPLLRARRSARDDGHGADAVVEQHRGGSGRVGERSGFA